MAKRSVKHTFRSAHHAQQSTTATSQAASSSGTHNSDSTVTGKARSKATDKTDTRTRAQSFRHIALITISVVLTVALLISLVWYISYRIRVKNLLAHQQTITQEYDFDPGNIISDQQFFDSSAMTEKQIQTFLTEKGGALATAQFDGEHISGNGLCADFKATGTISAAHVIATASTACDISPKVLLTMLQKEQHLVSEKQPTEFALKAAMGLSCPDTADCDPKYAGFIKQVYGAAQRYQYYAAHMDEYSYKEHAINSIQYSPQASCGASDVYIENRATALLYIYTPYQPNTASLKAAGGEGDSCSSYGNRNFSLIYSGWFGNPREE